MQHHPPPTLVLIVVLWFTALAGVLFLLTLQNALKKCAPASRTMKPGKVWLMLIPVFGFVWQFIIVLNISKSLKNEFARRGMPCSEENPGQATGLAMCVCGCCIFIPLVGEFVGAAGFVLWIVYWNRIANFSRLLDAHQSIAPASPIA